MSGRGGIRIPGRKDGPAEWKNGIKEGDRMSKSRRNAQNQGREKKRQDRKTFLIQKAKVECEI